MEDTDKRVHELVGEVHQLRAAIRSLPVIVEQLDHDGARELIELVYALLDSTVSDSKGEGKPCDDPE